MSTATAQSLATIPARVRDFVTGRTTEVEIPSDWTVDFATEELARSLELPQRDARNLPQVFELFLRRADGPAERLRPTSRIGDVLGPDDELEPLPEIVPGGSVRACGA